MLNPAAVPQPQHAPPQTPALPAPGSTLPTWEQFLEQAPHSNTQDILALLDGLASVPDASASHVAGAVLIIIKDLHLPPKASHLLNLATTAALLVPAVKNAWLLCPEANKHRLRPKLERLCSTVAAKFRLIPERDGQEHGPPGHPAPHIRQCGTPGDQLVVRGPPAGIHPIFPPYNVHRTAQRRRRRHLPSRYQPALRAYLLVHNRRLPATTREGQTTPPPCPRDGKL